MALASLTGGTGGATSCPAPSGVGPPTPESSDWLEPSSGRSASAAVRSGLRLSEPLSPSHADWRLGVSEHSEPRSSSSDTEEEEEGGSLEAEPAALSQLRGSCEGVCVSGAGASGPVGRWETWSLGKAVLQGMGLEMTMDFLFLDLELELLEEEQGDE